MTATNFSTAIVLFGHGSRDEQWKKPIEAVAEKMRSMSDSAVVACAYLELMKPDLPTVVRELVGAGLTQIAVVPMFLGVGRHAREDLPAIAQQLRDEFPTIKLDLRTSVGEEPQVIDLLAEIALGH